MTAESLYPAEKRASTLCPPVIEPVRGTEAGLDELEQQRNKNEASQDELVALRKARSLLVILLATSKETLLALEAAANVLDSTLANDLAAMIARSEAELHALSARLAAADGGP